MYGARPAGCQADTNFACQLGVTAGHEGSFFLMPRLDEIDLVLAAQRRTDAVDAVTRIAEQAPHTPHRKALEQEIANRLTHQRDGCGSLVWGPGACGLRALGRPP